MGRRRRDYTIVIAVLAIGWSFWLHRMGVNDHDDMLSNEVLFARQGLASLLFRIPWPDQSAFYFLYLGAVRRFGESAYVFQFVNAVLLSITLAATYAFAVAFSGSRSVAAAAVFLGAVSPTSLWLVRSGRMYSLQVLFSVLAALCVLRYLERRSVRDLAAFGVLSLLNIYTHFVGFLITALLFIPLIADVWLDRREYADPPVSRWHTLRPIALAAAALLVLTLPQIVRVLALAGRGVPWRADVSLPALSPQFLNRVSWFWFVNADWGALRPADRMVTAVYIGSIVVLTLVGLAAVRRRIGIAAAVWILLPLVGLGLTALRMDIRDRYFIWTLPMLWVVVATGAIGTLPSNLLRGAAAEIARGVRAALLVAVTAGSLWLLWHKLPERYAEWTKLMSGLATIYRPSMVVYMPPGSPVGSPRLTAQLLGVPPGLQNVRNLSADTREQFLKEVAGGQEFVFLVYGAHVNAEMRTRIEHLEEHQYEKTVLAVFNASAQVFTRTPVGGAWDEQRIGDDPSPAAMVAWARRRLQDRPPASGNASPLANAVVARVRSDGVVREARLFSTQHGEHGWWKLGPQDWDAIEDARTISGTVEQDAIAAHPAAGSTLVVALPAMAMKKSLDLSYAIANSGLMFRAGAPVDFSLYVDGVKQVDGSCPNTPGWKTLAADTSGLDGKPADVVMLITTTNDAGRHFAFRLDPSPERALASGGVVNAAGPVTITGEHTLHNAVDRLRVYRIAGDRRIDAQRDGRTYSAEEMHEAMRPGVEGGLQRRWSLGTLPWDAVGVTRQRSGGVTRDGIWAHPRNGTRLLIEAPAAAIAGQLRGYFGFTDHAIDAAKAAGVSAPVSFRIAIDGRPVYEHDAARRPGWTELAVPIGASDRERTLRIEISSAADSWAHFIFDLWSD